MRKEIGSFYEWEEYEGVNSNLSSLDFLFDNNCMLLGSGRDAIEVVIKLLKKNNKYRVLLPTYTCDTVINPFLNNNFDIHYFHIDDSYRVKAEEFKKLVEQVEPDVILFHTYYGFDGFCEIRKELQHYKNQGIVIIEDMTQSLFGKMDFKYANFFIGSLRKWLPITDGGFIFSEKGYNCKDVFENLEVNTEFVDFKNRAMKLKQKYIQEENNNKDEFLQLHRKAEKVLDEKQSIYKMSLSAINQIKNLDIANIRRKRNENYLFLKNNINNISWIEDTMPLEENLVPIYYPILIKNKRTYVQNNLISKGIFLPILWPIPNQVTELMDSSEMTIYNCMLAIPCDHRYCVEDMKSIIDNLNSIEMEC